MLAVAMPHLVQEMEMYLKDLETEVMAKVDKLEQVGWEDYQVKK